MRSIVSSLICISCFVWLTGCQDVSSESVPKPIPTDSKTTPTTNSHPLPSSEEWKRKLENTSPMKPQQWGEKVTGVLTKLPTQEKQVALTLDACGGPHGSGYDQELIDYLRQEKIPATLFVNSRWIKANESLFLELARDPLFEIANHGTEHRPLSVNGRSIYGISGTTDPKHIIDEVWENHLLITRLTGKEPRFFRSGTAYYDEIAVQLVEQMGEKVTHFDVIGDAGATFSADQVHHAMKRVKSGSIVILHMNQPQSGTAEGLKKAIPELKKKGFQFVKLEDSVTSNS